jgi:diphthine-ammonia ligase
MRRRELMRQEGCQEAPVIFVQAEELPKGALVEFQVNFHTGRRGVVASPATRGEDYDNDDDDDDEELEPVYASSDERRWLSESCETDIKGQGRRSIVFIDGTSEVIYRSNADERPLH